MRTRSNAESPLRVAFLDDVHNAYEHTDGVARLRTRVDVRVFTRAIADFAELKVYDALVATRARTSFPCEAFDRLPDLRLLVQTGTSADHIDLAAAEARGVVVATAGVGVSHGTAELAIGLAIAVMRGIPRADRSIRLGQCNAGATPVLRGKTLGVVGLGRVGCRVARLGRAFGMRVVAYGPRLTEVAVPRVGVTSVDLDTLMRVSDVVSIHAALTKESRGLIDRRRIGLMKPTAYLVNTARGAIVDEDALAAALATHRLAGAGLDVFGTEPLPIGHPLAQLPNVVLTPHIGWPTDEAYERFADGAADVVLAFMDGKAVRRISASRLSQRVI